MSRPSNPAVLSAVGPAWAGRSSTAFLALVLSLSPIGAVALDLATIGVGGQRLTVEVARTSQDRARGLMGRASLAPDRGMFFDFGGWGRHPIWMKNTLIPLDILWLDGGGTVIYIRASAEPCRADPCPIYQPDRAARFVLELSGGGAGRLGVAVGDRLDLE